MRANKFANIILISGILYFISLLIYGSYRIAYYGLNKYYLLIVIVASTGIIICAWGFKLRPNYKVNLVLTGLSMVIGVYLMEIFVFLITDITGKVVREANKMGIAFDIRTKEQVINDLKNNGVKAVPFAFTHLFHPYGLKKKEKTIYPLGGISNITTVVCNESGEWTIYDSDEHGFNNPKGVFANKKTDIVLVGDSFTYGNCVNRAENIAGQLQAISGKKVVNLGIADSGPLTELARLKEYGEFLKPKYILWFYFEGNDLMGLGGEKQSQILLNYLFDSNFSQHLMRKQLQIDRLLMTKINQEINNKSGLRGNLKKILVNVKNIFKLKNLRKRFTIFNPPPKHFILFKKIMKRANDLAISWEGKLYFIYLPDLKRYRKYVGYHPFRQEVLSIINSLNIPVIDIQEEVFATHPDPLSLFPFRGLVGGHYNAEGYRLVSQTVSQHLQKEQEMPK